MECSLGKGELMRLSGGAKGLLLRSRRGTLWLTTGDGRDYLIHEGGNFQLSAGASALVEALGVADLGLEAPLSEARYRLQLSGQPA